MQRQIRNALFVFSLITGTLCSRQVAASRTAGGWAEQRTAPPPFHIRLLPGYHLQVVPGIDTHAGEIAKRGGLKIRFDMAGELPTNHEEKMKPVEGWNRQCDWSNDSSRLEGKPLDASCVIDETEKPKAKTLGVSFPDRTQILGSSEK